MSAVLLMMTMMMYYDMTSFPPFLSFPFHIQYKRL